MKSKAQIFVVSLLFAACHHGGGNGSDAPLTTNPPAALPSPFLQIYPVDGAQGTAVNTYFRWENSIDAEKMALEIGTDPSFSSALVSISLPGTATETTLAPETLAPSQLYFWRVISGNSGGETQSQNGPFSMLTGDGTTPVAFPWNYDGDKAPSDPDFLDTLGHFFYPAGKGPLTLGYAPEKLVIVLSLRGGNQNWITMDSPLTPQDFLAQSILPRGWFGVDPNYPVFDTSLGEKYQKATAGVALLVQFLRANAAWMNLDPDRVFSHGRSFGGIHSYAIGFKEDYREPDSLDPVKQQSSRPNFILPMSAASALNCMGPSFEEELSETFLPSSSTPGTFLQDAAEESAYWWLLHPLDYERQQTPPMYLIYKTDLAGTCGSIIDPHDGVFGIYLHMALEQYTSTAEPELATSSHLLNASTLTNEEIYEQIAGWIEDRLSD